LKWVASNLLELTLEDCNLFRLTSLVEKSTNLEVVFRAGYLFKHQLGDDETKVPAILASKKLILEFHGFDEGAVAVSEGVNMIRSGPSGLHPPRIRLTGAS